MKSVDTENLENLEYTVASSFRDLARLTSIDYALKCATSLIRVERDRGLLKENKEQHGNDS